MRLFTCESCHSKIEVDDGLCGELTRCRACGADQVVPDPVHMPGTRFDDYRVDGFVETNPIWASYAATGVVDGNECDIILKTPTSFFLKRITSPTEFGEMIASHGSVGIPGFHRLLDWSLEEGCSYFAFAGYGESTPMNELSGSLMPFDSDVALDIVLRLGTALGHLWDRSV